MSSVSRIFTTIRASFISFKPLVAAWKRTSYVELMQSAEYRLFNASGGIEGRSLGRPLTVASPFPSVGTVGFFLDDLFRWANFMNGPSPYSPCVSSPFEILSIVLLLVIEVSIGLEGEILSGWDCIMSLLK